MIRVIIIGFLVGFLGMQMVTTKRLHTVELQQLEIIKRQQTQITTLCEVTSWQENLLQTNVAKLAIRWSRDTSDICK